MSQQNPNLVTQRLALHHNMGIEPRDLLHPKSAVNLPIEGDYIPVYMTDRKFDKVAPVLEPSGERDVRLTLPNGDFGFMAGELHAPIYSPLLRDIVFTKPTEQARTWDIVVQSEQALTVDEQDLVISGTFIYVTYAQGRFTDWGGSGAILAP